MIGGKRLTAADVKLMVKRNNWTFETIYDEYESEIDVYADKNFFVVVDETAFKHVYKCLSNNNGAASIDEPRFSDTAADDVYYSTSDGYVWKYMYSIDRTTFDKFATTDYIPLVPNANVSANAVSGSIDVIKVASAGQRYDNYYYGRFNNDDLRIGGDPTIYNIGADASSTNGFYTDCIITIVEGTGKGEFRRINQYTSVATSKQITVNGQFTSLLDVTSRYEITPLVEVNGNGTQSVNCVARALVNSTSSNSIYQVEILNRGAGYLQANASVLASANVGVTNTATLQVVIPPPGGHGSDAAAELGATTLGISVKLSNTENNTLTTENDFRTFGIMTDPAFSNVNIKIFKDNGVVGSDGTFLDNEGVLQYYPVTLTGTVSINTTSNTIVGTNTDFENALVVGERVVIKADTNHFTSTIVGVSNNTQLILNNIGGFTNAAASIAKIKTIASANVLNISSGVLDLTNVRGEIQKGEKLIGLTSQATAFVNTDSDGVKINNIVKDFDTFTQLHRMEYSSISSAFDEDEVVYQVQNGNLDPTARFHSSNNTFLFVTNKFGIFNNGNTVVGNTSGAEAEITAQWPGDILSGSGRVIYMENIEPIPRSSTQSETFKIIVEY
jgi:hypothetical protein